VRAGERQASEDDDHHGGDHDDDSSTAPDVQRCHHGLHQPGARGQSACTSPAVTCQAQYYVAFTNCFAPGSGVTCATTLTALARIVQNPVL